MTDDRTARRIAEFLDRFYQLGEDHQDLVEGLLNLCLRQTTAKGGVSDAEIEAWEEDARALGIHDHMIAYMRKMLRKVH